MKYKIVAAYILVGTIFLFMLLLSHFYMQKDIDDVRREIEVNSNSKLRSEIIDLFRNDADLKAVLSTIESSNQPDEPENKIDQNNIGDHIKGYILRNPEVVVESITGYYKEKKLQEKEEINQKIADLHSAIYAASTPFIGQEQAEQIVVSFLDPACGKCGASFKESQQLLVALPDKVKIIHRWTPQLNQAAVDKAKFLLTIYAVAPDKYNSFVEAVFSHSEPLTYDDFVAMAKDNEIPAKDIDAFIKNEENIAAMNQQIKQNIDLFAKIGGETVPYNIVNDKLFEQPLTVKNLGFTAAVAAKPAAAGDDVDTAAATADKPVAAAAVKDTAPVVSKIQPEVAKKNISASVPAAQKATNKQISPPPASPNSASTTPSLTPPPAPAALTPPPAPPAPESTPTPDEMPAPTAPAAPPALKPPFPPPSPAAPHLADNTAAAAPSPTEAPPPPSLDPVSAPLPPAVPAKNPEDVPPELGEMPKFE